MPHASRADLSRAFCSYCGYPPMGRRRDRAHRVCMRCQMGVVLRAPEGAEPRHDDPFLIVNRELAVQAVSRNAELVLSIDEPASLGFPLEQFLICCNGDRDGDKLAQLVEAAFAGFQPSSTLEILSVANSEIRLGSLAAAPPGSAADPKPPRIARNGVTKRTTAHQPGAHNGGFPGQRDMTGGDNLASPGTQLGEGQLARAGRAKGT